MGASLSYPDVDLSGKVAVVTGGNTGIGYETAKCLARMGAHTFVACRSKERAEAAIERMKSELSLSAPNVGARSEEKKTEGEGGGKGTSGEGGGASGKDANSEGDGGGGEGEGGASGEGEGGASGEGEGSASGEGEGDGGEGEVREATGEDEEVRSKDTSGQQDSEDSDRKEIKVEFLPLDLSSFQSTIDCVRLFKEKNLPLHILVNNAGIFAVPYRKSKDGFDTQIQVNHLGPMLLTLELLPLLLETAASCNDGRIVFVSSAGHAYSSGFSLDELEPTEENYKRIGAYNASKKFNVMVGFALQRRLQNASVTVSSVNPGFVQTEASRGFEDKTVMKFLHGIAASALARNPAKGAATSLNCAVNPTLNSQQHFYYDSCRPKLSSADSRNEQFQEQLWNKSCELLKDRLSPETWEKYGPKAEEQATIPEGEDAPKPEGEDAPSQEDASKPEGEDTPKPEGEDTPKPEGEDAPKPEGEDTPKPEGEDVTNPGGDVPNPEGGCVPKAEGGDPAKAEGDEES